MNAAPSRVLELLDHVTAEGVRFIKLGRRSMWWPLARDTNTLRLGFREFDFSLCKAGNWDDAKKAFTATTARTRGERRNPRREPGSRLFRTAGLGPVVHHRGRGYLVVL